MTEELSIYNAPIATIPQHNQALVEIEQQRAMAEVQSAIVLAKSFPKPEGSLGQDSFGLPTARTGGAISLFLRAWRYGDHWSINPFGRSHCTELGEPPIWD